MTGPNELTDQQRQGAMLTAAGYEPEAVARVLNLKPGTVRGWNKLPSYQVAKAELEEKTAAEIEPMIERVRVELVEGASKAIKTLVDLTEATNKDGTPANAIRVSASQSLLTHLRLVAAPKSNENKDGEVGGSAVVVIQPPTQAAADKTVKAIEGTASEMKDG